MKKKNFFLSQFLFLQLPFLLYIGFLKEKHSLLFSTLWYLLWMINIHLNDKIILQTDFQFWKLEAFKIRSILLFQRLLCPSIEKKNMSIATSLELQLFLEYSVLLLKFICKSCTRIKRLIYWGPAGYKFWAYLNFESQKS